jgi:hypothetical protein
MSSPTKDPKDLRLRKQHFPTADKLTFDKQKKGFIPLPISLRKLMRYITPPQLKAYVYLCLRASQYQICYPTLDEMAHDLGFSSRKKLTPHLKTLEEKQFISTANNAGKKFFLIHDPMIAAKHLVDTGEMLEADLFDLNELLLALRRDEVAPKAAPIKQTVGRKNG